MRIVRLPENRGYGAGANEGARVASGSVLVVSHAPPRDVNDDHDRAHRGFTAFRWLVRRLRPPLWLHGHVTTASVPALRVDVAETTLVNVTGSVLVELLPPA